MTMESGYQYVETYIRRRDGALLPAQLPGMIDFPNADAALLASHNLLTKIGRDVSTVALMGTVGLPSNVARELMHTVSDDGTNLEELQGDEGPYSCTGQRLCQYSLAGDRYEGEEEAENLRSHTDWTIATLVPVSDIEGLEVWNPILESWTRPEVMARYHWLLEGRPKGPALTEEFPVVSAQEGEVRPDEPSWKSHYVIWMAGKWLEILSNGRIESVIHRVVVPTAIQTTTPRQTTTARKSVPFFFRPRERIPLKVQKHFGEAKSGENGDHPVGESCNKSKEEGMSMAAMKSPMGGL